ncbi:hypothetical protein, partial [Isoptericola halotolerans]
VRGKEALAPQAPVVLVPGDVLLLIVPHRPDAARQVTAWARGEAVEERPHDVVDERPHDPNQKG